MNEFRIWDEKENIFIDTSVEQLAISKALKNKFSLLYWNILPYIGKDDIDGNKIYADSSIVEFNYPKYKVGTTIQDGYNRHVGYFKFNNNTLSYMIYMKNLDDSEYRWHFADIFSQIKNLKIIDTIQENKLGLKK